MKPYFFSFIFLSILFSCQKEKPLFHAGWVNISKNIRYQKQRDALLLQSGNHHYVIPNAKLPFRRVILLNASMVGYLTALEAEKSIVGVSSPEYIYSEKVHQRLQEHKILEVGNEQKYDLEKIWALQPDAVFTNYIAAFENTYDVLKKSGIEVIFIDEYLEEKPLEKTAIIGVFGQLLGKEKRADQVNKEIRTSYFQYREKALRAGQKPLVLTNEIYGGQWYVAGGNSQLAHFIKDAGGRYLFQDNQESRSMPRSFEEVFSKAQDAAFWVNVGNHHHRKELLSINPNYAKMKVFQKGNLYAISGREKGLANDFFESGVLRADLVLKDYILIFHPDIFPKDSLRYMRKLK